MLSTTDKIFSRILIVVFFFFLFFFVFFFLFCFVFFSPRASFSISCELSPMEKSLHDVSVPVFLRDGDFIHVLPAEPAQRVVKVNYHCD